MPKAFSKAAIERELVSLARKAAVLSRWDNDLRSAKAALDILPAYREQVISIANSIPADSTSKNSKTVAVYQDLRGQLAAIKDGLPRGLERLITNKIAQLEASAKKFEEHAAKVEAEVSEATELYEQLEAIGDAYTNEALKIVDHDRLFAEYHNARKVIEERLRSINTDEGRILRGKVSALNTKVAEQHRIYIPKITAMLQEEAEKNAKKVADSTVNQVIYHIAPPQVRKALEQLASGISGLTAIQMQEMLSLTSASDDSQSLVAVTAGQLMAVTGKDSKISEEITALTKLPKEKQAEVALALITGQGAELVGMSASTQLVLTAALVNQLAIKAGVSKSDQVVIRDFAGALISDMARVEKGEASHLSVMVEVEAADGEKHIAGFHIDLRALMTQPIDLSVMMARELLKLGVKAGTPVVTLFTSLPQVGALMQLEGRSSNLLQQHGGSLQALTSSVVQDTSSLKQITNGEVTDVSDNALIAVTKQHNSSLVSVSSDLTIGAKKASTATVDAGSVVFNVLSALAVMQLTVQATVFNAASQKSLGLAPFVGGKPLMLSAPTVVSPGLALGGVGNPQLIAAAASVEPTLVTNPKTTVVDEPVVEPVVEPIVQPKAKKAVVELSEAEKKLQAQAIANAVKAKLDEKAGVKKAAAVDPVKVEPAKKEPAKVEPVKTTNPIDIELVKNFEAAIAHLNQLHEALENKYGPKKDIVETNSKLIEKLNEAILAYISDGAFTGDAVRFKNECLNAVGAEKTKYNTHRDNSIKQFFGDIAEAFSNLWAKLTLSKTDYAKREQSQVTAASFFSQEGKPAGRLTRSAQVLHDFKKDIDTAFQGVGVEPPHPEEGVAMGHGHQ